MDFESPAPVQNAAQSQTGQQSQPVQPNEPDLASAIKNLEQGYRSLGYQLFVTLAMVTILNISVNVYLWKQLSILRKQAVEMNSMVEEYELRGAPKMNDFLDKLKTFSKANPDFNGILSKYWTNNPGVVMPPKAPVAK
jgi:hypothetical protein